MTTPDKQEKDQSPLEAAGQNEAPYSEGPSQSSEPQEDHQESFLAYVSRTFHERCRPFLKGSSEERPKVPH